MRPDVDEEIGEGSWIRLRRDTVGFGSVGIVVASRPGYWVVRTDGAPDGGIGVARSGFDLASEQAPPHEFFPMRKIMPYGAVECGDGSLVLFNRDREALFRRRPGAADEPWPPGMPLPVGRERRFYAIGAEPWRDEAAYMECVMVLHGISSGEPNAGTDAPSVPPTP